MDSIDREILEVLREKGRMSLSDISRRVNLSVPAVSERIRKLEESSVIEGYTVRINREAVGMKLLVYIMVNIDTPENTRVFRERIVEFREVIECHHIVGEYDYMLKVLLEDTRALEDFLMERLKRIEGVQKTSTTICLSTLKEEVNRRFEL